MSRDIKLTDRNYPTLLQAFQIVSHDCDVNGPFYLPADLASELPGYEKALSSLNPEDLETFCIGEERDQKRIARRNPILQEISEVINAHFGF